LQFATQNYTQTNKICEELLYKLIFFDCVVWKISKITTHQKKDILSPEAYYIRGQHFLSPQKYTLMEICKVREEHFGTDWSPCSWAKSVNQCFPRLKFDQF
jgi:hypothetical protein